MSSLVHVRPQRILWANAQAVLAAGVVSLQKINLAGMRRVQGVFRQDAATAPAAGFPRVRQSASGLVATWDLVTPILQDLSQLPAVVFPFDVEIVLPYVAVEWQNGAAPVTLHASVWALPE